MRLIILIIVINFSFSLSKENIFEIESPDKFMFMPVKYCDSLNFYIAEEFFNEFCKIKIYKMNLQTNKIDSFYLDVPFDEDFYCDNDKTKIYGLNINKDKLEISLFTNFIIFKYDSISDNYFYEKHINFREIINEKRNRRINISKFYKITDNKVLGVNDAYHKNLIHENGLYFWELDLKNESIIDFLLPPPKGFKWTIMQPKSIIDYHKGQYIYSDLEDDKIYFFKNKDSVTQFDLDIFNNNFESVDKQLDVNHPEFFLNSNEMQKDSSYLIHRVDFLDEDNILVSYSIPKTFETSLYHLYNFSLVYKDNKEWKVKDKIEPELIFGNNRQEDKYYYWPNIKVINSKLISVHYPYFVNKRNNFYRIEDVEDILERIYREYNIGK